MDSKEILSVNASRKCRVAQTIQGKAGVFKVDIKKEDPQDKKKRENCAGSFFRRPNTATGAHRKGKSPSMQTGKSFSHQVKRTCAERQSVGNSSTPSTLNGEVKKEVKKIPEKSTKHYKIDLSKDTDCFSLLSQAVYEQSQIIETLNVVREKLREQMAEKAKERLLHRGGITSRDPLSDSEEPDFFENAYSGTLDEIFQAWGNLFYFIINLKINLRRTLKCSETQQLTPDVQAERKIIKQAIECVKLFSRLKMKSLLDLLDCFPQDQVATSEQIRDYEQRLSSVPLCEMIFIQSKMKQILLNAQKKRERSCGRANVELPKLTKECMLENN